MRDRLSLGLLAFASVAVVCAPLLADAWVGGHEGANYLYRTAEFKALLAQGEPWPRWAPDFYWGYGYPFFVFYPPGVFWLSSLLGAVIGVAGGLKATVVIGSLSTFFGTRHLLQAYAGEGPARLGAACATVFQWHFVQVYVRGDLAEAFATSLLPWVIAAVLRDEPRRLAGWLGAVALCHTLTAVLACWVVGVLGLLKLARRDGPGFGRTVGGGALGLAIAAGYLLPAFVERALVRTDRMVESVEGVFSFHYGDHFVGLLQRFEPGYRWGTSVPGLDDRMPLGDPPWAWAVVIAAVALAATHPGSRRRLGPPLFAWLAVLAMVTAVSRPVWAAMPLGEFFQFPWRWLLLQGIVVGVLAALVVDELDARSVRWGPWVLGAVVLAGAAVQVESVLWREAGTGAWIALGVAHLAAMGSLLTLDRHRPAAPILSAVVVIAAMPLLLATFHKAHTTPTPIAPSHVEALDDPVRLQRLDLIDPDGFRLPIVTDAHDAYRPLTAEEPPLGPPGSDRGPRPAYDLGPPAEQAGAWRRWYVDQPAAGVREATWFVYPGVKASVDGAEVPVTHDARGLVQIDVPPGPHVVDVWYAGTGTQRLGVLVSLAALLLLLVLTFRAARRRSP